MREVVNELAGNRPQAEQFHLESYLLAVPAQVRRTLRRPADAAGRTVPKDLVLARVDDLVPLLPPGPRALPPEIASATLNCSNCLHWRLRRSLEGAQSPPTGLRPGSAQILYRPGSSSRYGVKWNFWAEFSWKVLADIDFHDPDAVFKVMKEFERRLKAEVV